ncbi:Teichoic acid export ABC transporter family protein [Paenibacillus mucilaginosus 3016]|uniref:Teichoic acid export ABC transporter family protein n=1 Tax=Paenibacillus mucilaginosus 3016 TaxID=1116391 RepID=H6NSX4_9BACL|nr:ABC transporter ATP-binding protein [Paenibacillus mucilaginosus]AFC27515.1 Teichoic acid export ABC transporter family protein [Paenibacillus mucilaginosus 3016]WFA16413.1 ABC transporter ATP-binding protein [Paenibacillus mucilaginosus]
MDNNVAIEVKNVTKTYKLYKKHSDRFKEALSPFRKNYHTNFYALNDISFKVRRGEIIGIIGKNGSGKSTVLKIITGVLSPTEGKVDVNGKISALLELGAGFNGEYTGIENIYLNGLMLGFSREEMQKKIDSIIDFAEIGEFINQPVKSYSSGMFARLAFSVAINVDPDILIVDEALAVGDLKFQLKCMEKFNEFRVRGKTILFVSHDINSIKRYCNRVVWINEGRMIAEGDAERLCDKYTDYLKYGKIMLSEEGEGVVDNSSNLQLRSDIIGYIESVKIFDSEMNQLEEVQHGNDVYVHIDFFMNRTDIKSIVIGLAIHTIDDFYVCGLNSLLDNMDIDYKFGKNTIIVKYKDFNLLGGTYYFDAALFESNAHVPIDYKAKIKTFFVEAPYKGEGLCIIPHEWSMKGD